MKHLLLLRTAQKGLLPSSDSCPVFLGCALPGRVPSQQGEDEGGAGHDAQPAECHPEVR